MGNHVQSSSRYFDDSVRTWQLCRRDCSEELIDLERRVEERQPEANRARDVEIRRMCYDAGMSVDDISRQLQDRDGPCLACSAAKARVESSWPPRNSSSTERAQARRYCGVVNTWTGSEPNSLARSYDPVAMPGECRHATGLTGGIQGREGRWGS